MNATRWVSLSEFVKHLGREGIAQVEEIETEGEHGWYLRWIDTSPAALARQDALQKMDRAKVDEEGRMRKFLKDQIQRAREQEQEKQGQEPDEMRRRAEEGLQRERDGKPLKIGISLNSAVSMADKSRSEEPTSAPASSSAARPSASAPFKLASNPFKVKKEAPKLGAGLKATSASAPHLASPPVPSSSSRPSSLTAAEKIMAEERDRSEKRKLMGPQPSAKRMRM